MRLVLFIALVFAYSSAIAQTDLWSHVGVDSVPQSLQPATLTKAQLSAVARLLRHQQQDQVWDCEGADLEDLIKGLTFEKIPVLDKGSVVLASAGAGCARGGQGSNGAMWIIRFNGATPSLLAAPDEFSGWLFSIQPNISHGYPDIVLGWHMSAFEADLSYFRFDGKAYHRISTAKLHANGAENDGIVPDPR